MYLSGIEMQKEIAGYIEAILDSKLYLSGIEISIHTATIHVDISPLNCTLVELKYFATMAKPHDTLSSKLYLSGIEMLQKKINEYQQILL